MVEESTAASRDLAAEADALRTLLTQFQLPGGIICRYAAHDRASGLPGPASCYPRPESPWRGGASRRKSHLNQFQSNSACRSKSGTSSYWIKAFGRHPENRPPMLVYRSGCSAAFRFCGSGAMACSTSASRPLSSFSRISEELPPHARLPEFVDMRGNPLRSLAFGLCLEEGCDLVCHIDELGLGIMRHRRCFRGERRCGWVKISKSSPRTRAISVMPASSAVRMASAVGAEMAISTGAPRMPTSEPFRRKVGW